MVSLNTISYGLETRVYLSLATTNTLYACNHMRWDPMPILVVLYVLKLLFSSCWPLAVQPRDERGRRQVRPVVKRAVARAWQQRELC